MKEEEDALSQDEDDLPSHLDEHPVSQECLHERYQAPGAHAYVSSRPNRTQAARIAVTTAVPPALSSAYIPFPEPAPQPRPKVHSTPETQSQRDAQEDVEGNHAYSKPSLFVLPLWAVLGTASVGLVCFLDSGRGEAPEQAFSWLSAVASVAALQSWAGMTYTYIRSVPAHPFTHCR